MSRLSLSLTALLSLPGLASADDPQAVEPRPANADAELPAGFPDATHPGAIEIKHYPAYRSAVARGSEMTVRASDSLFWPLFQHITARGVEMTAPVVSTYQTAEMVRDGAARGEMTMEFLYRRPDLGETGPGVGKVEVLDHPPMTVVAIGVQGAVNQAKAEESLARLQTWLDQHRTEWVVDGPPRRLGYHGPMTPAPRRLWEFQIPVKAVLPAESK